MTSHQLPTRSPLSVGEIGYIKCLTKKFFMFLPQLVRIPVEEVVHDIGMLVGEDFLQILDLAAKIVLNLRLR